MWPVLSKLRKRPREVLPPAIHAQLVDSLFGTVTSFISGAVGGLLVPVIALGRTRDPIFIVATVVMLALGAFRLWVYISYQRLPVEERHRRAKAFEILYALGAIGFMLGVGVTAALLLLLVAAFLLRALWLNLPDGSLIFDETYYVKDAESLRQLGYEGRWPEGANELWAAGTPGTECRSLSERARLHRIRSMRY